MEINEKILRGLIKLVKSGRKDIEDIQDEDYKREVEKRIIRE